MEETDEVSAAWVALDDWLSRRAKRIRRSLAPGASDAEIGAVEARLGFDLPEDVRTSYRIHNGGEESDLFPASEAEDMGYSLIPLEEIVEHWEGNWQYNSGYEPDAFDVDPGVRSVYWDPKWVPLATNGGGDYHCVDLNPDEGGTVGQVIEFLHETNERRLLASSWTAWLRSLADGLESKQFKYDAECGIVRKVDRGS